ARAQLGDVAALLERGDHQLAKAADDDHGGIALERSRDHVRALAQSRLGETDEQIYEALSDAVRALDARAPERGKLVGEAREQRRARGDAVEVGADRRVDETFPLAVDADRTGDRLH